MYKLLLITELVSLLMFILEIVSLESFSAKYKLLDKAGKCIGLYTAISLFLYVVNSTLRIASIKYLVMALNINIMLQFVALSPFYYFIIKNQTARRWIKIMYIPAIVVFFLDFFWWHGPYHHTVIFLTLRNTLLLAYGGVFFLQLLRDRELMDNGILINTLPNFWYNAGLFVYHCTFFLLGLSLSFFDPPDYKKNPFFLLFVMIHLLVFISGIIQLVCFIIGLRQLGKTQLSDVQRSLPAAGH